MLPSAKLFNILKFAVPVLLFLGTVIYFFPSRSSYSEFLRQFRDEKKVFISDFLQHEVDGQFNGEPISELCQTKSWTPGLVLSCEPPPGGLGEVKNAHLHCIRIAIEMGAELILPDIVRRSEHDIAKLIPTDVKGPLRGVPLDYFFDRAHLYSALSTYCPQMKIYSSINELYDVPSLLVPVKLSIRDLPMDFINKTILSKPQGLARQITYLLDKQSPPDKRKYPFRVHLNTPMFLWPTAYDPPDFVANFGRILRIREDVRRLAASALFNIKKTFNLNLDPRNGIKSESFMGVNLRTERDVQPDFPSYSTQAADYLDYMVQNKMGLVFLGDGATDKNVTAFRARAKDFNTTVLMKEDVLEGQDLDVLGQMTWDQRMLVDYEIMLRAGLVTGTSMSSFAWNLALRRRHAYGTQGESKPEAASKNFQFRDQYSTVFGKSNDGWIMQQTIWP